MSDRITIDDIRKAGHCVKGARRWFEANGLDFAAFLKGGISEQEFLATNDALAEQVVTRKKERQARG